MVTTRQVSGMYAAWAGERGLSEGAHDAAYEGTLEGVPVALDTGARGSGLYAVVVRIGVACGIAPALVKRGAAVGTERMLVAARAALDEVGELRSVRFEADAIELRLDAAAEPESIERCVGTLLAAWRSPGGSTAPFR